jgi:hypothetical protein
MKQYAHFAAVCLLFSAVIAGAVSKQSLDVAGPLAGTAAPMAWRASDARSGTIHATPLLTGAPTTAAPMPLPVAR